MIAFILGAVIGLIVGWNFVPQPAILANLISKILPKK